MRIVVADCSAVYTGRGDTKLEKAVRAIMLKDDGAISIHNDKGNKPLNYMGKGNIFSEELHDGNVIWNFDTRKENLTLTLHSIISDNDYALELDDPGLVRDGTENHLQEWLADNPSALGGDYTLIGREYETGNGPVDLLVQDAHGIYIAVEVKRVAMLTSVDQIGRYVNALKEKKGFEDVRGMVAALDIRPKTSLLAEKRGFEMHLIDNELWKSRKDSLAEPTDS